MMKLRYSILMILLLLFILPVLSVDAYGSAMPYEDVTSEDWFYEAAEYHYNKGIITGISESQFAPYEQVSRAQLAVMLYRMEGSPDVKLPVSNTQLFKDVTYEDLYGWYGKALWWAWEHSIVSGYENGCFGPADSITREQLCVMLYRYADKIDRDVTVMADISKFDDAGAVSVFATDAVKWAVAEGILTGKENESLLDPQGTATRAEAAVMLCRFDGKEDDTQKYPDSGKLLYYSLIVEDKDITKEVFALVHPNKTYALLPVTAVMEAAGAEVQWTSKTTAEIQYKEKVCILDMESVSITDQITGRSFAIADSEIEIPYETVEKELFLDSEHFQSVFRWMDIYVEIYADHEKNYRIIVDFIDDTIETEGYKLLVDGQDITQGNYVEVHKNYDYVLLPFTAVMEALGAEIKWESETVAAITFNERDFVLNTEAFSLFAANVEGGINLFDLIQDEKTHAQVVEGVPYVDLNMLKAAIWQMDIEIQTTVDHENGVIQIVNLDAGADLTYRLIVEGNDITQGNRVEVYKDEDYVLLPVVAVLEGAGADIRQNDEDVLEIVLNDMACTIDEKAGLIVADYGREFGIPRFGGDTRYRIRGDKLFLDTDTFQDILKCMRTYIYVEVDHQDKEIMVEILEDVIEPEKYSLIVNGQDITKGNTIEVHKNYGYTLVPFTSVLETLGAEVKWNSDTLAEVDFNGAKYCLDTEAVTLIIEGDSEEFNYFYSMAGGYLYHKTMEKEILLDANWLCCTLAMMGVDMVDDIDYQNHRITIDYRGSSGDIEGIANKEL